MKVKDGLGGDEKAVEQATARTIKDWTDLGGKNTVVLEHLVRLTADLARPGQTLLVRATIRDRRMFNEYGLDMKPQEAATAWHEVQIIDRQAKVDQTLAELVACGRRSSDSEGVRAGRNGLIAGRVQIAEALAAAGEVRSMQVDIRNRRSPGQGDRRQQPPEHQAAAGPQPVGVRRDDRRGSACDKLVQAKTMEQLPPPSAAWVDAGQDHRGSAGDARRGSSGTDGKACRDGRPPGRRHRPKRREAGEAQRGTGKALEQQKKVVDAAEGWPRPRSFAEARDQLIRPWKRPRTIGRGS